LQHSAAEPLALDQRSGQRDTILDRIAEQKEQLERQHEHAAEQLARAQRELQYLHSWNRAPRAKLETEINRHEKTLDRCDQEAEQLRERAQRRTQFLALAHQR